MAFDKIIDSAQLDGAMTVTADAIRGKTGGTDQIPWDAAKGFADAIAAIAAGGGGGTLAVNSGTFTMASNYTQLKVPHGCGKLPLIALYYVANPLEVSPLVNSITGGVWHRDSFARTVVSSATNIFANTQRAYTVGQEEVKGELDNYSFVVDETYIKQDPPFQWRIGVTFEWLVIYEV